MTWIVSFCIFGVVAGNVKLCNLVAGTSTQKYALPSNILAANKLQFKGFQPVVKRALSATNDTFMEITGYSTDPQVQIGKDAIVSPKSCNEASGSNSLTPSWLPVACAVATAMLPSGNRMAAAVPILAWAQGVEAAASCTETIEVTIYTPPTTTTPPPTTTTTTPPCSEDDGKRCSQAFPGNSCANFTKYLSCLKDADCCKNDEAKTTIKNLVDTWKALDPSCSLAWCSPEGR
jgi:hypothetical protein